MQKYLWMSVKEENSLRFQITTGRPSDLSWNREIGLQYLRTEYPILISSYNNDKGSFLCPQQIQNRKVVLSAKNLFNKNYLSMLPYI